MSDELAIPGLAIVPKFEPAHITFDFDEANRKLDEWLEIYDGMTEEGLADCKASELRDMRSGLNKAAKQLNDARIAIHKDYDKPYEDYADGVKSLVAKITEKSDIIKAVIDKREQERKTEKRAEIEEAYRDFAPMLAGTEDKPGPLPFDRIIEGEKWLNKSPATAKCIELMQDKVAGIVKDYKALADQRDKLNFANEDEAVFFRTLSLTEALNHERVRQEESDRIGAMKAAQADVSQHSTQAPMQGQNAPQPEPQDAYEPDLGDEPYYDEAAYEAEQQETVYVITFEAMTEGQLQGLLAYCRENGIHGKVGRAQ